MDVGEGFLAIEHKVGIGSGSVESALEVEMVEAGLGREEDLTDEVHLEGKIALIFRGEVTFFEKSKQCHCERAVGVVIYNNEKGLLAPYLSLEAVKHSGALYSSGNRRGIQRAAGPRRNFEGFY